MTIMWIDECGRCGRYHRPDYLGDCDADYLLPVSEESKGEYKHSARHYMLVLQARPASKVWHPQNVCLLRLLSKWNMRRRGGGPGMPSMKCYERKKVAKCRAVAERGEDDRITLAYYCAPCRRAIAQLLAEAAECSRGEVLIAEYRATIDVHQIELLRAATQQTRQRVKDSVRGMEGL